MYNHPRTSSKPTPNPVTTTLDYNPQWGELALRYIEYRLRYIQTHPALSSRMPINKIADEISDLTSIPLVEIKAFIRALMGTSIGITFPQKRAEQIAVAWSLENKKQIVERWQLCPDDEATLIGNMAEKIGAEREVVFAFNAFLESLYT